MCVCVCHLIHILCTMWSCSLFSCEKVTLNYITISPLSLLLLLTANQSLCENTTKNDTATGKFNCCFLQEKFSDERNESIPVTRGHFNYCQLITFNSKNNCGEWNHSQTVNSVCDVNVSRGLGDKGEPFEITTKDGISCSHNSSESEKFEHFNKTRVCCRKIWKHKEIIKDAYIALLFVGDCFLLLTIIVYAIIWNSQTIFGWTVFSEILANFFLILTVALGHLHVRDIDDPPPSSGCIFLGNNFGRILATTSHFFFLSTFCWMTAINFNLYRNLRYLRRAKTDGHWRNVRLYLYYALFAIGLPLLIVIFGVTLDHLHDGKNGSTEIFKRPQYGKKFCYISKSAQGYYIYYPIGTLIMSNVILFILTTWALIRHRQSTRVLEGKPENSAGNPQDRPTQSILLFAKLFAVMGVSWVFEVVAWAAVHKSGEDVPIYWIVFDITNLVQGIAVFAVFVCKKDVLILVKEKVTTLKCVK